MVCQGSVQMFKSLASVLPRTSAPVCACYQVKRSRAKHSLRVCTSERSPVDSVSFNIDCVQYGP